VNAVASCLFVTLSAPVQKDWLVRRRNPLLENIHERQGLPSSLSQVAGYFGVRQNPADLALTPTIGWCVTEPAFTQS
jgi:hypothetical protein